jgi:hypothetical protein
MDLLRPDVYLRDQDSVVAKSLWYSAARGRMGSPFGGALLMANDSTYQGVHVVEDEVCSP